MKTSYIYIPDIPDINNASPVTVKGFIKVNRLIEAWRYVQNLRYTNIGELFEDSIANAIESTVYSTGDIEVNVPDFYGAVEDNILTDLESMFGLERGKLYDVILSAIKWWKVIVTIPAENDTLHASTTTMFVDDPTEECRLLLTDLIGDECKRALADLEPKK